MNVLVLNVVTELSECVLISFYFILFYFYSALFQLSPPFYFQAHLSVILPQLFSYWFPLVYFSPQLFCCSLLHAYSLFFILLLFSHQIVSDSS